MKKKISENELRSAAWFPKKIYELDHEWFINWKFIGDKRFTEPFYRDTISRISSKKDRQITTPIDILDTECGQTVKTVGPSLFIFHVSRCGSTLLTQMLSRISQNIVISEAPVIDQLLSSYLPNKRKTTYLKNLILHLCKKRVDVEKYAFIKFDAWHLLSFDKIRKLFPGVPILILYRDPLEVLASHAKIRGQHMVPGFFDESIMPVDVEDYADLDGYSSKVLQIYFEVILKYSAAEGVALLNYNELIEDVWSIFESQMNINWTAKQIRTMEDRARYHSKDENMIFNGDNRDRSNLQIPDNLARLKSLYENLGSSTGSRLSQQ